MIKMKIIVQRKLIRKNNYVAIKNYNSEIMKNNSLNKYVKSEFENIRIVSETASKALASISSMMRDVSEIFLSNSARIASESIKNLVSNFVEIKLPKIDEKVLEGIKSITESFSDIILPNIGLEFKEAFEKYREEYSGEKLQEKVELVKAWADLGWVLYSELDFSQIFNPPSNQIEADEFIMSIFDEQLFIQGLNRIKGNYFVNDTLIDDIIFLYNNQRYSSCIMVTLNALERILLHHMKYDVKEIGLNYGISNKKHNKASFSKLEDFEQSALTYLNAQNLVRLIERIFSRYGKDWDAEPDFLARDYINHGMSDKEWTKVDAIKIALLLIEFSQWSTKVITSNNSKSVKIQSNS